MKAILRMGAALWMVPCLLAGGEWERHTIDGHDPKLGKVGADGVRLADVNGDGQLDVVTGWENGDAIRICFHPGTTRVREVWPGVTVGRKKGAEDAVLADLDGKGALEVVSSLEGKVKSVFIHWGPEEREDLMVEESWKTEAIPALEGRGWWMFALPMQVDGVRGVDLVVGSKNQGAMVGWVESPEDPRKLGDWRLHQAAAASWIMSLRRHDVDGDGREDVIYSDRKGDASGIYWLRGRRDERGFEAPRLVGGAGKEVMFLDIADVNGDGREDVVFAAKPRETGVLFHPGPGREQERWAEESWEFPEAGYGTAKAVRVGDLNEDGKLDVVLTCEQANGDRVGAFLAWDAWGERTFLDFGGPEGVKFDRIELLDLDGDGDLDVMTCEERDQLGVFWYENPLR